MGSISPLTTVLFILIAVGLAGAVAFFLRDRMRFRGYEELTSHAIRIAHAIKGETFRDGADLVMSGTWKGLPTMVRFSTEENTPGLNIRMSVPANFTLSVMSTRATDTAGRVVIRTTDEMFNARFVVRSDHATQARMFIGGRQVMQCLNKLCRTADTYLLINIGVVELNELALPDSQSVHYVLEYVDALGKLAAELREMPGAETIKIDKLQRERNLVLRGALAVGVIAAIGAVFMAARPSEHPGAPEAPKFPVGVWANDGVFMPRVNDWRLAVADDFDASGVGWLQGVGAEVNGRIPGDYCGTGEDRGVAYVLVREEKRRVVLLCRPDNRYDVELPKVAIAARIPKAAFASIKWAGARPGEPDGDGLLIARDPENSASALILFNRGGRMLSAAPVNYQSIRLD